MSLGGRTVFQCLMTVCLICWQADYDTMLALTVSNAKPEVFWGSERWQQKQRQRTERRQIAAGEKQVEVLIAARENRLVLPGEDCQ